MPQLRVILSLRPSILCVFCQILRTPKFYADSIHFIFLFIYLLVRVLEKLREEIHDVAKRWWLRGSMTLLSQSGAGEQVNPVDFTPYQLLQNEFLKNQALEDKGERVVAKFETKMNEKVKELARVYARNASLERMYRRLSAPAARLLLGT